MLRDTARGAIGYDDRGTGDAIVLCHAFPFDRRMFDDVAALLEHRYRVIAVDARGFGETPLGAPYTIADLADDVAALLDTLGIARATLVGNSMGGYTALAFARRHRSRLNRLVLVATRATADSEAARATRTASINAVKERGAAAFLDGVAERLLSRLAPPALRDRCTALAHHPAQSLIAALEALRDRPDRSAELRTIEHPTIVVAGELDTIVPPDDARALAAPLPNRELHLLKDIGHLIPLEAPGTLSSLLTI